MQSPDQVEVELQLIEKERIFQGRPGPKVPFVEPVRQEVVPDLVRRPRVCIYLQSSVGLISPEGWSKAQEYPQSHLWMQSQEPICPSIQ